jgi:endonuclease/exonuclease/phosphatase family metal-dependent hydrolase
VARDDLPPSELTLSNATAGTFAARLALPVGPALVPVLRGWSTVDVEYRGRAFRFANTHLEAFDPAVRLHQARELAAALAPSPVPVVLAGDLNTLRFDVADAYGVLLGRGFVDAWVGAMGLAPWATAGQAPDLDNDPSRLDHTVDYVLHDRVACVWAVPGSGEILGEEPGDRTPSGLWPSDHAGVVVDLRIPRHSTPPWCWEG